MVKCYGLRFGQTHFLEGCIVDPTDGSTAVISDIGEAETVMK